jgi:broad specificity phosphatase PhoE
LQTGVKRVLLVRHATTAATARRAFPADEALGSEALADAALLATRLPQGCVVVSSPALRCLQTADAAKLRAEPDPRLVECDFGSWAGRTLAEVDARDAALWMSDPNARPHGGESLTAFAARVAGWLDEQLSHPGESLVAITHGGVIKASIVHALAAPIRAFWSLGADPLRVTELHAHDRRWTVHRVNCST